MRTTEIEIEIDKFIFGKMEILIVVTAGENEIINQQYNVVEVGFSTGSFADVTDNSSVKSFNF
ncbi:MAG: hypothetical protein LBC74_15335 [Planctomycetaceae bacterium]|nr:hypothetical protein [Planctomycetaceae bacterium]